VEAQCPEHNAVFANEAPLANAHFASALKATPKAMPDTIMGKPMVKGFFAFLPIFTDVSMVASMGVGNG